MKEEKYEIESIIIDDLFDEFNYNIIFNNEINIITSPNGFGKSTILRMMYNFSSGNYHSFFSEVFSELTFIIKEITVDTDNVNLQDGINSVINSPGYRIIQIKKLNDIVTITDLSDYRNKSIIIDYVSNSDEIERFLSNVESFHPYLDRVGYNRWVNEYTGEIYDKEKVIQLCGDSPDLKKGIPNIEWLDLISSKLRSYYITTDRIRISDYSDYKKNNGMVRLRTRGKPINKTMINVLADDIRVKIQEGIQNQFERGRQRESSFPKRLIKGLKEQQKTITVEDVIRAINDIQYYEDKFTSLGILSENSERTTEQLNEFFTYSDSESVAGLTVLKVYLDDIKLKLKTLDGLSTLLHLFKNSVNRLLSFKEVFIDTKHGFVVKTRKSNKRNNKEIELSGLSSGEQHLIVMLGKLIFNSSKGDVVLIDEPEISFHPEWQEIFIDIIEEIRKLKDFKVVMATHSPILIGGRWDNVVELAEQHQHGESK